MWLLPQGGKPITIDVTGSKIAVNSDNAGVTFTTHGSKVEVTKGAVAWKVNGDKLDGFQFNWAARPAIGGMPIAASSGSPQLLAGGGVRLGLYFALPKQFGGATSSAPVNVDLGVAGASANGAFTFKVAQGGLPGLPLTNLIASFQGVTQWSIDASVALPQPIPLKLNGGIAVNDGIFASLYGNASFGAGGPKYGPVTLKKLSFAVELNPKVSKCVPKVGKETINVSDLLYQLTGYHFNVPNQVIDHGNPVMALCGNVSLAAGPTLLGKPAVALDGGLGFTVYNDRPAVFRAYGSLSLVGIAMTNAEFEVHTNGYVGLRANFGLGWNGLASIKGYASLEMQGLKFNGEGGVKACLDFIDTCLGANALLSSKGIAVCLNIDTFLGDWHPGFADKWGQAPKLYFSGCDVGPYRENIHAAQAGGARAVTLGKDLPGAVDRRHRPGCRAARGLRRPARRALRDARRQPAARWQGLLPDEVAEREPHADRARQAVRGHLARRVAGRHRDHVREVRQRPRRSVGQGHRQPRQAHLQRSRRCRARSSRSASAARAPARPSAPPAAPHGTLRFSPAAGRAERREIVATVEQDGQLRAKLVVAHYRAPGASKPRKVAGLKARRAGKNIVVGWRKAGQVELRATLGDGRRIYQRTRGHQLTLKHAQRATITVRGLSADGVAGAPATVKVR